MSRALAWVRRWGISVASLAGGTVVLFVLRRDLPGLAWIVGYLVLLGLVFSVLTQVRQTLETRGHRRVITAADYTIQTLYHGLLVFMLPAYYASATLASVNVLFLGLLVALALLATFDPWYRALVHPHPWLNHLFFVVTSFAALNVALPLVGVPPFAAMLLGAWLAVVALTPVVQRRHAWRWPKALALMLLAGLGAVALAALLRVAVPPAPLALAEATLARDVVDGRPVDRLRGAIAAPALREGGLVAYTAVYAPAGLWQPIQHVWRRHGRVVDVVKLEPIRGGRRGGYRTYSRKTTFGEDPVGGWSVDVMTSSGQLIGRLRFRVTA